MALEPRIPISPARLFRTLALCVVLGVTGAHAQLAADSEWAVYTSMTEMNDIAVDGDDVWLATGGGVLHYNRSTGEYRRFTRLDGLGGNRVLSLTVSEDGTLWCGTAGRGLSRLRPGENRFDAPFLEFRDRDLLTLTSDGDVLYVGTDRGVSVFLVDKEEVRESYRRLGNLAKDAAVLSILVQDSTLYVGTAEGMAWARLDQPNLQDPDSWRSAGNVGRVTDLVSDGSILSGATALGVFTYDETQDLFLLDFNSEAVTQLGQISGEILAATTGGNFMRREAFGDWSRIGAPLYTDVRGLSEVDDGSVWIATGTGLAVLRADAPPPSGEPGSSQFFDLQLAGDDLWAASVPSDQLRATSAGVYRLRDGSWTVFDKSTGMPNDELVAVETDREGRIWVGSWGGGISVRVDETWQTLDESNSALRGIGRNEDFVAIGDIERDADGNMWVVNVAVGVAVIDRYPQLRGFLFDQVALGQPSRLDLFHIAFARDGHKLLASRTDGLVILDDGGTPFTAGDDRFVVVNRTSYPQLSSNVALHVLEDADGIIWLATDSGLNAIDGHYDASSGVFTADGWRVYGVLEGLGSDEINALELDGDGNLWVGTNGGLSRIDDGELAFTLTSSNSGLINDRVTGLHYDAQSNELWVGTIDGLNRLRVGTATDGGGGSDAAGGVYPNPFVTDGRHHLTFAGLPLGASVRIYTAAGEPVASVEAAPGSGTVQWNGLNEAGFLVGSGIYLYVAQAPSSAPVRGRFAVIEGDSP